MPLTTLAHLLLALVFVALPGGVVAAWLLPRAAGRGVRLGTGLALSPALGGVVIALLLRAGVPLRDAAMSLLLGSALLSIVVVLRDRRCPAAPATPDPRATWWLLLVFVTGTALFPTLSEWWRIYSDGWTHSGIVRAIEVAGVPPLDPGFAGVPLQYAWIYHTFVAGAHAATGVDVYVLMALLASIALAAVVLCAGSIAAGMDRSAVAWTLVLLLLGMNAVFPLFLPVVLGRAFTGEVRGMAEVARQFDLWPLQSERTGVFLRGLGGEDFFLDKFMVATPFALSLGAMTAWLACFRRWIDGGSRSELVLGALLTLAAGLMHPVVGLHLGAISGLLFVLFLLARRDSPGLMGRVLPWGIAVFVGLLPVVLYTRSIIGGSGGTHHEFPMDITPLKILGYASCLGLGLFFGARPLRRMLRGSDAESAWALALLAAFAVALLVRLPGPSAFFTVDKFAYLAWIPLAITAGPAFASFLSSRSRPAVAAIALLLFLPVNGLMFASRIADPQNHVRQPWDRTTYTWLKGNSPANAVLLTPAADWETAQFVGRDQYYSHGHPSVQLGYDLGEIAARSALVDRVFRTGTLSAEDRARLLALGRPVYIVWTDFREPLWRTTPGAITRNSVILGTRPAFDASLPLLFEADGQEVRALGPPIAGGPGTAHRATIAGPDSMSAHP
jgi:hypothetical protein